MESYKSRKLYNGSREMTITTRIPKDESEDFISLWETVARSFISRYSIKHYVLEDATCVLKRIFSEGKLTAFGNISFNEFPNCVVYVRRYAALHTLMTKRASDVFINNCDNKVVMDRLFSLPEINIVSVGGGPGNDVFGFLSSLGEHLKTAPKVRATVMEHFTGWAAMLQKFKEVIQIDDFRKNISFLRSVQFKFQFAELDQPLSNLQDELVPLKEADVVLLVKVLSILPFDSCTTLMENITSCMKPGAVLLVIDTCISAVEKLVEEQPEVYSFLTPTENIIEQIETDQHEYRALRASFRICAIAKKHFDEIENVPSNSFS